MAASPRGAGEAFGQLVLPAVFKTVEAEDLGLVGSIPIRLRHRGGPLPARRDEGQRVLSWLAPLGLLVLALVNAVHYVRWSRPGYPRTAPPRRLEHARSAVTGPTLVITSGVVAVGLSAGLGALLVGATAWPWLLVAVAHAGNLALLPRARRNLLDGDGERAGGAGRAVDRRRRWLTGVLIAAATTFVAGQALLTAARGRPGSPLAVAGAALVLITLALLLAAGWLGVLVTQDAAERSRRRPSAPE